MSTRTRKFIGTIALLAILGLYLPVAMIVGANHFTQVNTGLQVIYFLSAGLLWIVPAGLIIRWMVGPGPE